MESNVQSVKYNYMKGWIVVFAILFVLAILAGVVFNVTTIGSKKLEIAVSSSATDVLSNNKVRDILKDKYKVSVKETYYSDDELIMKELLTNNKKIYNGIIFGDKKYLDYYKTPANISLGEKERDTVKTSYSFLTTPLVIYTWDSILNVLVEKGIVSEVSGTYYITNMNDFLELISGNNKWSDIGLNIEGNINVETESLKPYNSAAAFYELLLLSISNGDLSENNLNQVLSDFNEIYSKKNFLSSSDSDLFDLFLRLGINSKPMIAGYESEIIKFSNEYPDVYATLKDKVKILYPASTIMSSYPIATLDDDGALVKSFDDKEIQEIILKEYGLRVDNGTVNYDVSTLNVSIPATIKNSVDGMKLETYNKMIGYLK